MGFGRHQVIRLLFLRKTRFHGLAFFGARMQWTNDTSPMTTGPRSNWIPGQLPKLSRIGYWRENDCIGRLSDTRAKMGDGGYELHLGPVSS